MTAKELRDARLKRRLTIEQLSALSGISASTINHYELERGDIGHAKMLKLEAVLVAQDSALPKPKSILQHERIEKRLSKIESTLEAILERLGQ